jgi:hypothetical protein
MRAFNRFFARTFAAALGAGVLAGAASASAMTFRLQPLSGAACRGGCPMAIVAEGQITNSTPEQFVDFLRENAANRDLRTVVFLNSEGGYVVASMELGKIFRRIGAATVVARLAPSSRGERFLSANCLSACVYAFMGGRKRVAPQGSALGIHRMFANQEQGGWLDSRSTVRRYDNGTMAAYLEAYSANMGVSRDLIRTAEHISSSQIHLVTSAEMARWNLARRVF